MVLTCHTVGQTDGPKRPPGAVALTMLVTALVGLRLHGVTAEMPVPVAVAASADLPS